MNYWDRRYRSGGNSGAGSLGEAAKWKADVVNARTVGSVLDIGSGDGHQARLLTASDYLGVDPSEAAVLLARRRCPEKRFELLTNPDPRDTHLSLDVLFHLTNDDDYLAHLGLLFSARRRVVVYASDHDEMGAPHVLHRHWTPDVPEGWELVETLPGAWSPYEFRVFDRQP